MKEKIRVIAAVVAIVFIGFGVGTLANGGTASARGGSKHPPTPQLTLMATRVCDGAGGQDISWQEEFPVTPFITFKVELDTGAQDLFRSDATAIHTGSFRVDDAASHVVSAYRYDGGEGTVDEFVRVTTAAC